MSQRTEKVASLIQHLVAGELSSLPEAARLTVTGVKVSPDLRACTVWIGIVATDDAQEASLFESVVDARKQLQTAVARRLTTKFVPRINLEHDRGGEHAERISRVLKGL